MTDEAPSPDDPRFELARGRTEFAAQRTSLASDRTTLARLRTALTMSSFGFGMSERVPFIHAIEKVGPADSAKTAG